MTDEDATDEPSSDLPDSSQDDGRPPESVVSDDTEYITEEHLKNSYGIFDFINMVYHDRYYWEILKSAVVFVLALKLARECRMMRIPMKEYKPFNK